MRVNHALKQRSRAFSCCTASLETLYAAALTTGKAQQGFVTIRRGAGLEPTRKANLAPQLRAFFTLRAYSVRDRGKYPIDIKISIGFANRIRHTRKSDRAAANRMAA
jgi:hypothetical protein